jgi:type III restriction enzyme
VLLNHWFKTDHRLPTGQRFVYHHSQQAAIETLIYLFEVASVRRRTALLETYAHNVEIRLPTYDDFARYCIKMATGSGKTKVMALAIAWQYFNAVRGEGADYAQTFLILAPNVIVFERLKNDFAGGDIFKADPVVPRNLQTFWDLDCVMRGEGERAYAEGLLFLSNIQQFYERPARGKDAEPEIMTALLGPKPATEPVSEGATFMERIAERDGRLMVVNDEAHHTHDEESEWNGIIRTLHGKTPLAMQLDVTATPRFQKGGLFPWTIFDYPLKQAIVDNVVKRPVKGITTITEAKSDDPGIRYEGFLVAAVARWREYRDALAPLRRRPLLFVMMNSTQEADEVAAYLQTKYPDDLGGDKTLVIHTDNTGEVSKKHLEAARRLAHQVDQESSGVNAIVSVLMLREGWDVQNVTVVLGLRPYSSKANILPEQTIGRGLRLMFRGAGTTYEERVDIIGNKAFMEFVGDLEKIENVSLDTFEVGKDRLVIYTIMPVADKKARDIGIPQLTPLLGRKKSLAEEIAEIDVMALECPALPLKANDAAAQSFKYEGYDIISLEKLIDRDYTIPEPQTSGEIIGYYARLIARDLKLPSQFNALYPKLRAFFERKAFGRTVDLDDIAVIRAMNQNVVAYVVQKVFGKALRERIVEELTPTLRDVPARYISETPRFPFGRPSLFEAKKCMYNYVPAENEFERKFGLFLEGSEDVAAFAKLPDQFGFAIEYTDNAANLRYYYPDFVVRTEDGACWLVETKGAETVEVARKDQAARLWCENATALTGEAWGYLKVPQKEYERLQPASFGELHLTLFD